MVSCVGPGESCLYTWENPLEKRLLFWSAGMEADTKDELIKVRNWENLNADTQILRHKETLILRYMRRLPIRMSGDFKKIHHCHSAPILRSLRLTTRQNLSRIGDSDKKILVP